MEFSFYNPTKIIFGKGRINEIGAEMAERGVKKALLVMGGGSIRKNGVYSQVTESLKASKIQFIEAWGVQPNPTLAKVREMIEVAEKEKVDAVLAVGGGSVIDSSKAVAAGVFLDDIWEAYAGKVAVEKALPLFVVLTISATGSEMDATSVLTNEEERKKWSIKSTALYPVVSIIDPSVQETLPAKQTAYGAIDGLSHIMENYFVGKKEEATLALDESLMRTIVKMADILKDNPKDYDARSSLAWSLTLAINGICGAGLRGGDWASHRIEHGISALHTSVAHGAGLSVVFPAWVLYVQKYNQATFDRWAKNVWDADSVEEAVRLMKQKFSSWGAPISLRELKITEKEISAIAEKALEREAIGVLKQLTKKDVEAILRLAL